MNYPWKNTLEWKQKRVFPFCILIVYDSVQSVELCTTLCDPMNYSPASLSITNSRSLLKLMPIESVMPSNCLILFHPLLLPPSVFLASGSFSMSLLITLDSQSIGASASSVLPMNIQGWLPSRWLIWSPCSPRDSQESSPIPQFKSINSLALSFLYSPTLTPIHDHWENHSLD